MKTSVEKFILSKPWNVGRFNRTFTAGTVLEVNSDKNSFSVDGHEYQDLSELKMAMKITDKRTGLALVLPFSEKSATVKQILSSVKSRIKENEVTAQKYKVIQSDADLVEDIDVSDIKIKPKEKVSGKAKVADLKIVQETGISLPVKGKSAEAIAARIEALQAPAKMKVVKGDEGDTGKTVQTSSNLKIKPISSTRVTKK